MLSHVIRAQSYDDSGKLATVGEYTIVRRKKVGSGEIFIGRSMTEGIPYLVAQIDYHRAPEVVYINHHLLVPNYEEAMSCYQRMIRDTARETAREIQWGYLNGEENAVGLTTFTDRDCCPIGTHEDITGKIVAIQSEPTRFDFTHSAYQLVLVEGGSGATGERGWTFYGVRLASRERGIWRRSDVLGVLRHDCMPLWAMYMTHEIRRCGIDGNPSDDTGGAEVHV